MFLAEARRNAGIDRQRQLETPLQKSSYTNGNDIRKKKKKKKRMKFYYFFSGFCHTSRE
jgi:hypothetical protein